jgi:hypothetical protein
MFENVSFLAFRPLGGQRRQTIELFSGNHIGRSQSLG